MAVFPAKVIAFNCKQNMFSLTKQKPKRNLKRFQNNFETFLSNDSVLRQLTKTIENGNQLFSSLIGCDNSEDDSDSSDFEGFSDNCKEKIKLEEKEVKNESNEKTINKTEEKSSKPIIKKRNIKRKRNESKEETKSCDKLKEQIKDFNEEKKSSLIDSEVEKSCEEINEKIEEKDKNLIIEKNLTLISPKKRFLKSCQKIEPKKRQKSDEKLNLKVEKGIINENIINDKKEINIIIDNKEFDEKKIIKTNNKKDVIKRELNHYADVMARNHESSTPNQTDEIANKIQKLLKSKWEERLKQFSSEQQQQQPIVETIVDQRKSSKQILRKARLRINKKTLLKIRKQSEQSFQNLFKEQKEQTIKQLPNISFEKKPQKKLLEKKQFSKKRKCVETKSRIINKSGQPGFITCTICNATKYYSHVQRRYGVFSCEPCSKFFARFIKDPKIYYCSNEGDCNINERSIKQRDEEKEIITKVRIRGNVSASRCKACWLKVCLQKFSIDTDIRLMITNNYSPKLINQPNVSLITVDTNAFNTDVIQTNNLNSNTTEEINKTQHLLMVVNNSNNNKIEEKNKKMRNGPRVKRVCRSAGQLKRPPRATFTSSKRIEQQIEEDSDELPVDVYLCRVYERESLINEEKNHKSIEKTISPKILEQEENEKNKQKTSPQKKYRCKECEGCKADDCGKCNYCLDKKKFGGLNVIKQACKFRTCVRFQSQTDFQNNNKYSEEIEEKEDNNKRIKHSLESNTETNLIPNYIPDILLSGNTEYIKPNIEKRKVIDNNEKSGSDLLLNNNSSEGLIPLFRTNGQKCLNVLNQNQNECHESCHTLRHLRQIRNN